PGRERQPGEPGRGDGDGGDRDGQRDARGHAHRDDDRDRRGELYESRHHRGGRGPDAELLGDRAHGRHLRHDHDYGRGGDAVDRDDGAVEHRAERAVLRAAARETAPGRERQRGEPGRGDGDGGDRDGQRDARRHAHRDDDRDRRGELYESRDRRSGGGPDAELLGDRAHGRHLRHDHDHGRGGDAVDGDDGAVEHRAERGALRAAAGDPAPGRERQRGEPSGGHRHGRDRDGERDARRHADRDDDRDRRGELHESRDHRGGRGPDAELLGDRAHGRHLRHDHDYGRGGDAVDRDDRAVEHRAERGALRAAAGDPAPGRERQRGEPGRGDGDGGDRDGQRDARRHAHRDDDRDRRGELRESRDHRDGGGPHPELLGDRAHGRHLRHDHDYGRAGPAVRSADLAVEHRAERGALRAAAGDPAPGRERQRGEPSGGHRHGRDRDGERD